MPTLPTPTSHDWHEQAACAGVDPAPFFSSDDIEQQHALSICAGCPVREPCLEFALRHGERIGIWGGMREHDRLQLTRQRRRVA